jgi:hypothetical protein
MVAVSMSGEAQWPSHRAPSVGTQLADIGMVDLAVVSLSREAQCQS